MKRSVIAILLIVILGLSGCKAQQEASLAIPAERIELDAETEQKEPLIVPNESDPEEEQPAEGQKEPEEEQPAEDQKTPEEQPAEKEEPEKEDPEIVKFWETVPEMSIDEALSVLTKKDETIKQTGELGTLTDEERMALYVLNVNFYETQAKYVRPNNPDAAFSMENYLNSFQIYLNMSSDFSGDLQEYFAAHSWLDQPFASEVAGNFEEGSVIEKRAVDGSLRVGMIRSFYPYFYEHEDYPLMPRSTGFYVKHSSDGICFWYRALKVDMGYKPGELQEFHKNIIRYYLSLKSVVYVHGPQFHTKGPHFD